MKPYTIYFSDFTFRIFYSVISYIICGILIFENINTIFLFETESLLSILVGKRLILTQISELFNTIWFVCISLSSLMVFPLIFYHIKLFVYSSWVVTQLRFFIKIFQLWITVFICFYLFSHTFIILKIISFFLYWEITDLTSLLRVEAEISLFNFIRWNFTLKFVLSFLFSFILIFFKILSTFLKITNLYFFILKNKKVLNFILICNFFLFTAPDFFFQLFLIILSWSFIDFFILLTCTKLYIKLLDLNFSKCQL